MTRPPGRGVGTCLGWAVRRRRPEVLGRGAALYGQTAVFGFYLTDDPVPRIGLAQCKPSSLRAAPDWIHEHIPGTLTFIVLMNLSGAATPSFRDSYNSINSHVD